MTLARASARWTTAGGRRGFTMDHRQAGRARRAAAKERRSALAHQRAEKRVEALASHHWVPWRGTQRFASCWCQDGPTARRAECRGIPPNLKEVAHLASDRGHAMAAATFGLDHHQAAGSLVWCKACGGWSVTGRSRVLRAPCGPPTAAGEDAARRLARREFPKGDARYRGVVVTRGTPLVREAPH